MSKSVLFIDDDETYLYVLERASSKVDSISEVYTAKNGKDALEKLEAWRLAETKMPNVMFVDVSMPVMDGFQFLEKFKAEREAYESLRKIIPVVMLTSSLNDTDKEKALEIGVIEKYIVKPSGTDATIEMLCKVV